MMTKKTKKPDDFSHIETDKLRATFSENPEINKELEKEYHASNSIMVKLDEYLGDTSLKGCEMSLEGFMSVLDHAKDEVIYLKFKPEDQTVIYHITGHPDAQKVLDAFAIEMRKIGFGMLDSRTIIQETAEIFKKKRAGVLKMKKGRHPKMGYFDKGD